MILNKEREEIGTFSWSGIIAGLIVATGVGILLSLLGLGFHAAAFTADAAGVQTFSAASFIWFVVNGIIALFVAGYITGLFLSGNGSLRVILHALTTWGVATILWVALTLFGMGALVAGAGEFIGKTLQITEQSVNYILPQAENKAAAEQDANTTFSETTKQEAAKAAEKASNVLSAFSFAGFFISLLDASAAVVGALLAAGYRPNKNS